MRYLMSLVLLLSFLIPTQAQAHHHKFNPNSQELAVGTVCLASKAEAKKRNPDEKALWTKYLVGHIGEKCWHLKGDTTPLSTAIKEMDAEKEQKLFNEFMQWWRQRNST